MGKDERRIVLSSGQKDRTLQNRITEIHGLAVFHELLEQLQDLLGHRRDSSCCKAAKILRSGCHRPLCFIILVENVSSVIDNFNPRQLRKRIGEFVGDYNTARPHESLDYHYPAELYSVA